MIVTVRDARPAAVEEADSLGVKVSFGAKARYLLDIMILFVWC